MQAGISVCQNRCFYFFVCHRVVSPMTQRAVLPMFFFTDMEDRLESLKIDRHGTGMEDRLEPRMYVNTCVLSDLCVCVCVCV